MRRLEISGTGNDRLSESEKQQLEDAVRILARMITRTILKEKSLVERPQCEKYRDSAVCTYQVTAAGSPDEPLTLSVQATARMLGLSRGSVYEAIRTGQIPSIRFGRRIVVPRAALNRMISQADNCQSDDRQYG